LLGEKRNRSVVFKHVRGKARGRDYSRRNNTPKGRSLRCAFFGTLPKVRTVRRDGRPEGATKRSENYLEASGKKLLEKGNRVKPWYMKRPETSCGRRKMTGPEEPILWAKEKFTWGKIFVVAYICGKKQKKSELVLCLQCIKKWHSLV